MPQILINVGIGVAMAALQYGLNAALSPSPRKPIQSGRIDNLRGILQNNTAPVRVIYGTYRTSGVLLYARSVNPEGKTTVNASFLHFAIALAPGDVVDIGGAL